MLEKKATFFIPEVNDLMFEISNTSLPNCLETTKYLKRKREMQKIDRSCGSVDNDGNTAMNPLPAGCWHLKDLWNKEAQRLYKA